MSALHCFHCTSDHPSSTCPGKPGLRKTLDLTSVVDAMARGVHERNDSDFDKLEKFQQRNTREAMLKFLLPAVPVIEEQLNAALAAERIEAQMNGEVL